MPEPLPVTVTPRPGESIESWLEHLADANGLHTAALLTLMKSRPATTRFLTLAPSSEAVTCLARLTRVGPAQIQAAALAVFHGTAVDLSGLDHEDRHSYRLVAARGWTPAHGTQLCPACLADTGAWMTAWRLPVVTACHQHRRFLAQTCPGCRRPFRDQRHSHLRAVGAATICGNPLSDGPTRQCPYELTGLTTPPTAPQVLATQTRVDRALAGGRVFTLDAEVSPASYLGDLRHLATLLLHLALQPGASDVAAWTSDVHVAAEARGTSRAPRWGLCPPDDPVVRGTALATADAILAAPDLGTAAGALVPWLELTRMTVDGPLGWLADRTVMTSTLTQLVMAARAPHRRLSHRLDHHREHHQEHPDQKGPRMAWSTNLIPQVLPHRVYVEHLDGASDSREETVRLFASLSVARMLPGIRTWAAAAEALGMPPELGSRTGRTCSATMRVSADEWEARIYRALQDTHCRDYRQVEAKVRYRAGKSRWFDEWSRVCRPGTRPATQPLAVTWQWVHVAHGHLDQSPGWQGLKPTARDRARYRQFEASLDDTQRSMLDTALNKRG